MVDIKLQGNKIIITADLTAGVPSRTGKTLVVASTNGFVPVADSNIRVSLNVIKAKG